VILFDNEIAFLQISQVTFVSVVIIVVSLFEKTGFIGCPKLQLRWLAASTALENVVRLAREVGRT
jgi:hypothetical protein